MKLNKAISIRISELLTKKQMTQYSLFIKSGVPKSISISDFLTLPYL